jgi:PAS domain S-box-containing protein
LDRAGRLLQIKGYLFDDTERQRSERLLQEAEERYRLLVEMIPDAVLVSDAQSIRFVNPAMARLMGVESSADLVGRPLLELFHPEDHAEITRRSELALSGQGPWPPDRRRLVRLDGRLVAVESTVAPCLFDGQPAILRVNRDITERVKAEEELLRKDKEISQHARRVEELNTALSVLLEHRDLENRQKEDLVRATLTKLILPHLATLQATRLDEEQETAVELLEANLSRIMTSLSAGPLAWQEKLTPTELQVAELLRLGKRTKEIAAFLKISPSAVAFHRANIRHKLGLTHRRVNLISHLSGLEEKPPARPELASLSRNPEY